MTAHELARALLALPDLPVFQRVDADSRRCGDFMPVTLDSPKMVRLHGVSYGGYNEGESGMFSYTEPFDAIEMDET